jgi:uncharacterized membrane protein
MDGSDPMLVMIVFVALSMFLFNVLPWILTLVSSKVSGSHKLVWFLFAFFLSWIGYFVFYFISVKPAYIEQQSLKQQRMRKRDENGMPIS